MMTVQCTFRISKAKSMAGFVKRQMSELRDMEVLKSLYVSLVRPQLEYCTQVWSNTSLSNKNRIESIQRRFTKLIAPRDLSYDERCNRLNFMTLENRRSLFMIMFCFDVIEGYVQSSEILSKLNFLCSPRQFRSSSTFRLDHHTTNYGQSDPVYNMMSEFNKISHLYQPGMSRFIFKNSIIEFLTD